MVLDITLIGSPRTDPDRMRPIRPTTHEGPGALAPGPSVRCWSSVTP